jgi:phosphoadenosine phosphosulfate reductase
MKEPLINKEDMRIWENWQRQCLVWSKTRTYKKAIYNAKRNIEQMATICPNAYIAYSGGKDSTVMLHLASSMIPGMSAMSVKDDMDFPGEEEYVRSTAKKYNVPLDVIKPTFSCQQWLSENAKNLTVDGDMHSRQAKFSDEAFYQLIEKYRQEKLSPGVYLGLRKKESHGRLMNRVKHGAIYLKQNGETVCQPICDLTGQDLYAYIFENNIELLPLYQCVRLATRPDLIRKSWWIVNYSKMGGFLWLKTYYPSLYDKLKMMFVEARAL